MNMDYEVEFRWTGDIDESQDAMIEWLEARGYSGVCSYGTDGTGSVALNTVQDIADMARDLGVVVTSAELVDVDALIGVETEAAPA